ncbi:hypothetical protein Patl1_00855 [Pistacia atlantica]|uniref:Uncharacterized protein n=1 Tax=Pistacia atlantica TaxID=434234 RepID=A0ACC1CDB7_9ROSI|nr:hypothetical protein Patl1_00855 [Pistacia atlantica]
MRAAIAGLEGTPYCHGLFFFDILIPSRYPAQPPEIFFYSYNFDVNPHLNSSGKRLSLDLLWNSRKEQIYSDESKSNMQRTSDKSNKAVFMLNCEAMLHTLQIPPRHFEDLVHGHFRKRAHPILLIYKKQINATIKEEECSGPSEEKLKNTSFINNLQKFLELS